MKDKTRARIVGLLILTAYLMLIGEVVKSDYVVLVADVISGLSVIGIAVLLAPYFAKYSKKLTLGYVGIKILEGILMVVGGLLYMFDSMKYVRNDIYEGIHLYTFIVGGFILYYLIFRSKILPRFIAIWGIGAILVLFLTTAFKLMQIYYPPAVDGLLILIISNEIFMAGWLIFRGFKDHLE